MSKHELLPGGRKNPKTTMMPYFPINEENPQRSHRSDRYQYNPFKLRTINQAQSERTQSERPQSSIHQQTSSPFKNRKRNAAKRPQSSTMARRRPLDDDGVPDRLRLRSELQQALTKLQTVTKDHTYHIKKLRIAEQNLPYNYHMVHPPEKALSHPLHHRVPVMNPSH